MLHVLDAGGVPEAVLFRSGGEWNDQSSVIGHHRRCIGSDSVVAIGKHVVIGGNCSCRRTEVHVVEFIVIAVVIGDWNGKFNFEVRGVGAAWDHNNNVREGVRPIFQVGQKKGSIRVIPRGNDKCEIATKRSSAIPRFVYLRTMDNDGIGRNVSG